MFIARNPDTSIFGLWNVRQFDGQEELPNNHADVIAFINRPPSAQQLADQSAITGAKVNPVVQYLVSHTIAECVARVNSDVVDLASAKIMLGHFAVALCVLCKDKLRD